MTLGKGNKLFKRELTEYQRAGSTVIDRMRSWLEANPDATEISDADLGIILAGNESYIVHEVMSDVHYEGHPDGFSLAPGVDLKVLH